MGVWSVPKPRPPRYLVAETGRVSTPFHPYHLDAAGILEVYRHFYNHDRANQSLTCGNRPPFEAFPQLPALPHIAEVIDPDAWLVNYHRHIFKRRVSSGSISVGNHTYYVGHQYSKMRVGVILDAEKRMFYVLHKGQIIRELEIVDLMGRPMAFQAYLKQMLQEAHTLKTD